ncbi:hypothetical protein SAMN02745671_02254 [Anaerovibrio lipolyticus DSM 3074]|uniref:Capsule polysaccharide biosynthesis protein n=1 Tax=Anaerovibrio lipolyticus DSM 3074 TaxID=1120997 RepID=A0A1M6FFE2_9FIRM|nr:hypothetical protein SAMN02745671_02254 [Anaerovibrio lipolyticus DSM 3074]
MLYSMDIFQCINDIEKKFPVCSWRVGDIDVWPIVRLGLFYENIATVPIGNSHKSSILSTLINEIKLLFLCLYTIIRDNSHNASEHESDVVFLGWNADRTVKLSTGELACQNLDMIKVELQKRGYVLYALEYISGFVTKIPRYTCSDLSIFWKLFKVRCALKFNSQKEEKKLSQLIEVEEYLKKNGFNSSTCEETYISSYAKSLKAYAECFYGVLQQTQAKMGVVVCWYSNVSMSFILACRKKGIPCIDIQHGFAGGNKHEAYYNWINIPQDGYNIMPTNFWSWSDKDAAAINKWYCSENSNIKRAFVGGNYTQAYLLKYDLGSLWNKKLAEKIEKDRISVLVTLQPGFKLPEWFIVFIKTSENIQWFIRCHPVMDEIQQEFVDKVKNESNVACEIASACPLVSVLELCNLHITSHSSVVIDAESYGVKSVCLSTECFNYFKENINQGTCFYVTNAVELNEIIKRETACIKNNDAKSSRNDIDMSGIDNLIRLINQ